MRRRVGVDRLTVSVFVVTAAVGVVFASMVLRRRPFGAYYDLFLFHNGPTAVIAAWLSLLVLRRQPGNGAGRVLLAIAVISALHASVAALADARLVAAGYEAPISTFATDIRPADLPLDAAVPVFTTNWLWVPVAVLMIAILPLVFPDGTWPSRRWWPVAAAAVAGGSTLVVAFAIDAWPTSAWTTGEAPAIVDVLVASGGLLALVAAAGGLAALAVRWYGAAAERRQPFHVVGATAGILALVLVATFPWQHVWIPAGLLAIYAMLGAYAVAVARYGLHDIEPFLGRAAVAALLSALIAAIYAGIVLGVGSIAGRPFDHPVLPILALATIALVIEPARGRARRLVDRWLFRARADRIEVLSRVAAHASTSPTAADVLSEVTELLIRSTGADRVEALLDADHSGPVAAAGGPVMTAPTLTVDLTYQHERLGELRLYARARADLVSDAADLLADVAHALGVVLRNEQLAAQLQTRLDELQASRHRLVEAHDRGRRSLERDIHDGAQSRLIALRLRIGAMHARHADIDSDLARELDGLAAEVDATVRSLRGLARGLAPPLLDQFGLATALRAHARALPTPITITADAPTRYPPEIESAAYFCCIEAIQNAVRHSDATSVVVELDCRPTMLRFEIRDDGLGFDIASRGLGTGLTNIGDRIAALGGQSRLTSVPGAGTRIIGAIPARSAQDGSVTADR